MKCFAILFSFVAYVFAVEQVSFQLPPVNLQNVRKAGEKCASEMALDPAILPRIADGTFVGDEIGLKFVFCVARGVKIVDEEGHYIVEKFASYFGGHPLQEKFKEALRKCNEASKGSPVETFGEAYRCYFAISPILVAL